MIITRTPFRISFFGGGTDYPAFYTEHGGAVLSTTINKYCYITCRYLPPFFNYKYRIRYTNREEVGEIDEIKHPSVRECLRYMELDGGVDIVHSGDIPAMSGIGSSSAFTVGLLNALYALKGEVVTKRRLAFDAIHVEQNMIGEPVGSQDQTAAAFGGFNRIEFGGKNDGHFVQTIPLNKEKLQYLQECLLFYFTGFSRYASEISQEHIAQIPQKIKELNLMKEMVDEAINILNGPIEGFNDFGKLLHESWMVKKSLTKLISTGSIDDIYKAAIKAGATGGKLCGAGAGGFMLLFVPPEMQDNVKAKLKDFLLVPFLFENLGSHVIFYSTT
jgi:D-glycero-alpha-D-manno-heptose-7-phosphate kinase